MQELVSLLSSHGVLIVFVVTLLARVGAPVPAAPLLVVAGGLATVGDFSALASFIASLLANIAGDAVWFWAGRRHGRRVMGLLCRISLSPDACVRQSEALITRWGGTSLVLAKFVPGVSVVAAPMAGALSMSWARFLAFDLLAATLWTSGFMLLGAIFNRQIQNVLDMLANAGVWALFGVALLIVVLLAVRQWRRHRFMNETDVPRIGVHELNALMRDGKEPVVVDVRSSASVEIDDRRIPGAIHLHLRDIDDRTHGLPRDREIVVYCNCPNEVTAAIAAHRLGQQGWLRVRPLAGGLDAWVAAGFALHGTEEPRRPLEPEPLPVVTVAETLALALTESNGNSDIARAPG